MDTNNSDNYLIVCNNEGQYSIWPQRLALPNGWEKIGEPALKSNCLEQIEKLWTDMRPVSLRRRLGINVE
jgi:MbtH protein